MDQLREEINTRLEELLDTVKAGAVKDAMRYSLIAPGKRVRPILFLSVLRSYQIDYHPYIDVACAIEMIHTYSLIHDDLPGMDNDDLRRGRPTCHKKFDEATAILAGDGLLNLSVSVILDMDMDAQLKVTLMKRLYQASGVQGMIYGQQQDIYFENKSVTLDELKDIHKNKTGEMIAASFQLASSIANPQDYKNWTQIGYDLGLAFQIQDDVLDMIGNEEDLGKHVGSDIENHKSTYVSLLGIEQSQAEIQSLFEKCYANLYEMQINHGIILEILTTILKRVK